MDAVDVFVEQPRLAEPAHATRVGAPRAHRPDIGSRGRLRRLQRRDVELWVMREHTDDGASIDGGRCGPPMRPVDHYLVHSREPLSGWRLPHAHRSQLHESERTSRCLVRERPQGSSRLMQDRTFPRSADTSCCARTRSTWSGPAGPGGFARLRASGSCEPRGQLTPADARSPQCRPAPPRRPTSERE